MELFKSKKVKLYPYDREKEKPVLHSSICTGETTAGFKNLDNGHFTEVMLIKTDSDIDRFKKMYDIRTELEKEY